MREYFANLVRSVVRSGLCFSQTHLLQVPFLGHFVSGKQADLLDDTSPDWLPTQNLGSSTAIGRCKRWNTKQTGKDYSLQENTSDSVMATHSDIQDDVPIQESNAIVHACTQIDFNLVKARLHIYTSIYHDTLNFQQWKYMKIDVLSMYGYKWKE